MSVIVNKTEVEEVLNNAEIDLFGRVTSGEVSVPMRLLSVFSEAYYQDYRPVEMKVLLESYKLLQDKGYYYTHE